MTEASSFDCLLNITLPEELEEELIDLLRAQTGRVAGFTSMPADGFGAGMRLHTAMEQVRGRSRRCLLQVLMQSTQVPLLLAELQQEVQSAEVEWWTVPLTAHGRLG